MARDGTRQELLARVEKLSPLIREYADQGERERHLTDPVVENGSSSQLSDCQGLNVARPARI